LKYVIHVPLETIPIGAQLRPLRNYSKRLTIQTVINLSVEPSFTNPRADSNTEILCHTHKPNIEEPMKVGPQKQSVLDIMTTFA